MPGAMAVSESINASGKEFINAMAIGHEMSYRIGKAMDYLRDVKDGKVCPPAVYGYTSAIFGAVAAIARLKGFSRDTTADALGIAGSISPVNSQVAWFQHAPGSTIKYLLAGGLTQSALTAAHMAQLGHHGDVKILDDRDFGYARFIGTSRWESNPITTDLGTLWRFPAEQTFKPYPHCRIFHALLDGLTQIVEENALRPEEIDGIKAWVEGFVVQPVWLNRRIAHVVDAQFSLAHGLALGAHHVPPGKAWQDPDVVFNPSVLGLMAKVTHEVHPDYVKLLTENAASRPARIEVSARGKTFAGERRYPKGSKSPDPDSAMTTDELVLKFRQNAEGVLPEAKVNSLINALLNLESVEDINSVTALMRKP
jgi:2-methylcitrate dehydratase PrpD